MLGGMAVAARGHRLAPARRTSRSATPCDIAGALGKMNAVDFAFDLDSRYNFWSGITGGLLPGALLLRHRPVAGAALPVGALDHREPPGPAVQRPVQGPDAVLHPVRRRDGVRVLPVQRAAAVLQRADCGQGRAPAPHAAELRRARADVARAARRQAQRDGRAMPRRRRGGRRAAAAQRPRASCALARRRRTASAQRGQGAGRRRRCPAPRPRTPTTSSSASCQALAARGLIGLLLAVILVRGDVLDRQRARRPRRDHHGRLLPAQLRPDADRPPLSAAARVFTVLWGCVAVASPASPRCSTT